MIGHPLLLTALLCFAAVARAQQTLDSTGSTLPAPTTTIPRQGCVTAECHPGIKQHSFLHGPVRVNGCDGCHTLTDPAEHLFERKADQAEMCALCHIPEAITAPFSHAPFTEGQCLSCHDPHGGTGSRMLRGERYVDSCSTCHQDMTGAHDNVHGPASVGACGACHEPHVSNNPMLLVADGRELCLKCHLRTEMELQTKPYVHAPALGDCRVCHDPHASDQPAILDTDPQSLCVECHQDIAHVVAEATTQHDAVTTKRACLNCHTPHASDFTALLREDSKQLCFECHNEPIENPHGPDLINMKELIETGTSLHGAITQRGCIECHEIHGNDHRRLLTNEYPSDLYFPFVESKYALCFSCHDSQLATAERTNSATGFRNGDTNLHFMHVNREKGRSCRVCHDAHAASRDKHIRESVPYGPAGWELPIGYEPLPGGGTCAAGCHQPFEYNRDDPVVYPPREPEQWKGEDMIPGSRAAPPKK